MVAISAIYSLFSATPKSYGFIFKYEPGIHDFCLKPSIETSSDRLLAQILVRTSKWKRADLKLYACSFPSQPSKAELDYFITCFSFAFALIVSQAFFAASIRFGSFVFFPSTFLTCFFPFFLMVFVIRLTPFQILEFQQIEAFSLKTFLPP